MYLNKLFTNTSVKIATRIAAIQSIFILLIRKDM